MAILVADRVQETTSTTGTGTLTLAGALAGYQSFTSAFPSGGQVYYGIVNGVQWEVGIGTYTTSGTTLARTTVLASSNGGTAITLAGTSNIFCDFPAALATILTNTTGSGNVVLSTGATLVTPNIGAATSTGIVATAAFAPAFTDGTVVDYTTGVGRVSVGTADVINLYTGGIGSTLMVSAASTGLAVTPGIAALGAYTTAYTDGTVVDYSTGVGRISVGSADTIALYTGGIGTTLMATFATTGLSITGGFSATTTSKMTSMAELGKVVVNNNAVGTYTVPANTSYVGFTGTNATTIAFTFPAAAAGIDGLEIEIYTQAAVSVSSTWASTGATFVGAPATLTAGSLTKFIYNHATTQWLPRG